LLMLLDVWELRMMQQQGAKLNNNNTGRSFDRRRRAPACLDGFE
jgi:hypothetical protein